MISGNNAKVVKLYPTYHADNFNKGKAADCMKKSLSCIFVAVITLLFLFVPVGAVENSAIDAAEGTAVAHLRPGMNNAEERKAIADSFTGAGQIEGDLSAEYGKDEESKARYNNLSYTLDSAYKIYSCERSDTVTSYEETGDFSKAISDSYVWIVPLQNSRGELVAENGFSRLNGEGW